MGACVALFSYYFAQFEKKQTINEKKKIVQKHALIDLLYLRLRANIQPSRTTTEA